MARIPRMVIAGEQAVYHVMSRTALDGFPFGDAEREYLVSLLNRLRKVYFTEILGFCCMGNHFHLLARMLPEADFTDKKIKKRYETCYGKDRVILQQESGVGVKPLFYYSNILPHNSQVIYNCWLNAFSDDYSRLRCN